MEGQDLLIYRVLFRDQPAIVDLVHSVLDPLREARGGPRPLLDTLEAYFASGGVNTATALRLHLSVRAVTYRLDRVRTLTAHDLRRPFASIHPGIAAVLGRKSCWDGLSMNCPAQVLRSDIKGASSPDRMDHPARGHQQRPAVARPEGMPCW